MQNSFFILIIIFAIVCLVYVFYKIMSCSESEKDTDLQITSQDIIEQLKLLNRQKKYNIAETLAKRYLEKKPGDNDVRFMFAKILHTSGRTFEAIDQVKTILKHKHNNPKVKTFLATCHLKTGNQMKAISIFEEVLEEEPDNLTVIKELANTLFETNQKKSALKTYQKLEALLENNVEKAQIKTLIAGIHTLFKEYNEAIAEYEWILNVYPDDINVKKLLIELYKQISNYDSLIRLANQIISINEINENGLWAMKMLMDIYNLTFNYDKALELAEKIKLHPMSDKISIGEEIAKILLKKNNIDECIAMLNDLIKQDSENISLKKELAKAYEKKQEFESAANIYKKIIEQAQIKEMDEIHFEISNIYSNWAMYMFSLNDINETFKRFITALQYYSENPDIYYKIGNVNQSIKNFNEAIVQYKKAIELDHENVDYYYAIAECYEEIDSIYEQKIALTEIIKYNNSNPNVYYKLGRIYKIQNDVESAVLNMKKAIELDENFVEAKHQLALIYEHIGQQEEAIILYEEILVIQPDNQEIQNNLKMMNG
jgi:tetratricopeptide (TPR) repeat protein